MRWLGYLLVFGAFAGTASAAFSVVPEIDSGAATGAIALVIGGYLVMISKFRRK